MQLSMMAAAARTLKLPRYRTLFREGSHSTNFYILAKGCLTQRIYTQGLLTKNVIRCSGDPVSKFALLGVEVLTSKPRSSHVTASEDSELLKINSSQLNIRQDGAGKVAQRIFESFVESELREMELFADLSSKQMKEVVPLFCLEQYEAGARIFSEGEPGNKVFIMLHGIVVVCKGTLELAVLDAASHDENVLFGEMAILDRKPRMAAVVAKTACQVLTLDVEHFPAFLLFVPDFKTRLKRMKAIRSSDTRLKVERENHQSGLQRRASVADHMKRGSTF